MGKEKTCKIYIPADSNPENAKREQFKRYQKDGQTVEVPIGRFVSVPRWVAEIALKIGDITDIAEE